MNRLEFNKVIKAMDINNVVTVTKGRFGTVEVVHLWEDVYISFSGSYYTIVKGRIPYELVDIIYQKYPKNPYSIRIVNDSSNHAGLYVDAFQVDTKEGLVVLLSEIADYNTKKNGGAVTTVNRVEELMTIINSDMLNDVKSFISTCVNNGRRKNLSNTQFERDLFLAIEMFDRTVNPFQDESIKLNDVEDYIKKISISADIDTVNHQFAKIFITDLSTKNETRFQFGNEGFSYQLCYHVDDGKYFNFSHYCFESGEAIVVDDMVNNFFMKYNIATGKIDNATNGEFEPTPEQRALMYNSLLLAIGYASGVTVDNMAKIGVAKKMVQQKKQTN